MRGLTVDWAAGAFPAARWRTLVGSGSLACTWWPQPSCISPPRSRPLAGAAPPRCAARTTRRTRPLRRDEDAGAGARKNNTTERHATIGRRAVATSGRIKCALNAALRCVTNATRFPFRCSISIPILTEDARSRVFVSRHTTIARSGALPPQAGWGAAYPLFLAPDGDSQHGCGPVAEEGLVLALDVASRHRAPCSCPGAGRSTRRGFPRWSRRCTVVLGRCDATGRLAGVGLPAPGLGLQGGVGDDVRDGRASRRLRLRARGFGERIGRRCWRSWGLGVGWARVELRRALRRPRAHRTRPRPPRRPDRGTNGL